MPRGGHRQAEVGHQAVVEGRGQAAVGVEVVLHHDSPLLVAEAEVLWLPWLLLVAVPLTLL
jgi:hypothetical protein